MAPRNPRPPSRRSGISLHGTTGRLIWVAIAAGFVAVLLSLVWLSNGPAPRFQQANSSPEAVDNTPVNSLPTPAQRPSRYLNTGSDAHYVGAQSCANCHSAEHQSFLATAHSQALGLLGTAAEPADGRFVHPQSTLAYSVVHDGDQTLHRVVLDDEDGTRLVECEFPIKYHIGSGNHSRSYLLQKGDFLFESPLTWYVQREGWGLSPGYDRPLPTGFDRMVDHGCLICHAGRIESPHSNRFQPKIIEGTIGCESCHGPGSLHVQRREKEPSPAETDTVDFTIVNPARLERDAAEQICSFCHLRGDATTSVRGRNMTDFRPSLMLSDFRIDYFARQADDEMSVTGHVEQMRLSKCYQSSPNMTCITCHDPHSRLNPEQRVDDFRQKCQTCHEEACGLASEIRLKQQPNDDCAVCHMPRGKTDIPHIAFTHHRIAIHSPDKSPQRVPRAAVPELVADASLDHLSAADQLRCLGLAYVEISDKQRTAEAAQQCRESGRQKLQQAYEQGIRDAATLATLSGLEMERGNRTVAMTFARAALREPNANSGGHENARFVLANAHLEMNNLEAAEAELKLLVQNRRRADDWMVLAEVRDKRGDMPGTLDALHTAEQLNPFHPQVQHQLADALFRAGDREAAERHVRIERRLLSRLQNGATSTPK